MTILREKNTCTKKKILNKICLPISATTTIKKLYESKNPRRQTFKLVNYNIIDRKKFEY